MIKGRKETPPSEQLWELRKARDRYNALADQVRDDADFVGTPEEKSERERDARRIAIAYEKSIANMVASCHIRDIDTGASNSGSAGQRFALAASVMAIAAGIAFVVLAHPAIRVGAGPDRGADKLASAPIRKGQGEIGTVAAAQRPNANGETGNAVPVPVSRPEIQFAVNPRLSVLRTVRTVEPVRNKARSASAIGGTAKNMDPADWGGSGFVAKVLQQDGSLKEEHFNSTAQR